VSAVDAPGRPQRPAMVSAVPPVRPAAVSPPDCGSGMQSRQLNVSKAHDRSVPGRDASGSRARPGRARSPTCGAPERAAEPAVGPGRGLVRATVLGAYVDEVQRTDASTHAPSRRTCGARSENGNALEKGAEVMVARYEKGIAYVKRWEEISGE